MPLNRRNFMTGIGVTAGVGIMSSHINVAQAAPHSKPSSGQVPGIYRTKIGSINMTSVFDGGMQMGAGIVNHPDQDEINALKQKAFISGDVIPGYLNTFLVQTGKKLVLIDTGAADYGPGTGHLVENLAAAGYKPADIDEILLTHAHPDHVKGLLDKSGAKVFPKAKIRISEEDLSFWFSDEKMNQMPGNKGAFDAARTHLTPYKQDGQLDTFALGSDLGDGFTSVDLRGHTPGHSGFRISDGKDQLLIWGDIVHMQALQFAHPEWSLTYDIDPEQGIKSRMKILDEVTTDRLRIGGMHLSFPGLGHVEKSNSGYALVPQLWEAS